MSAAVTFSMSTRSSLITTWAASETDKTTFMDEQDYDLGEWLWAPRNLGWERGHVIGVDMSIAHTVNEVTSFSAKTTRVNTRVKNGSENGNSTGKWLWRSEEARESRRRCWKARLNLKKGYKITYYIHAIYIYIYRYTSNNKSASCATLRRVREMFWDASREVLH